MKENAMKTLPLLFMSEYTEAVNHSKYMNVKIVERIAYKQII